MMKRPRVSTPAVRTLFDVENLFRFVGLIA
jgi:hypothetical protein